MFFGHEIHFAFLRYQLHFFSLTATLRTGRTPSLCSKTSEYARKRFSRAAGMDTCSPAGAVRQVGEDRPTTEQRPGGLLRLSSHLDYSFQCARAYRRSRLQVRIGSKENSNLLLRGFFFILNACNSRTYQRRDFIPSTIIFPQILFIFISFLQFLRESKNLYISISCLHIYFNSGFDDDRDERLISSTCFALS